MALYGHTSTEGTVSYNRNPKFSTCIEEPNVGILNIERKWAVLNLHRGDMVNRTRTTKCLGGHLAQTEVFNLALSSLISSNAIKNRIRLATQQTHFLNSAIACTVSSIGVVLSVLCM